MKTLSNGARTARREQSCRVRSIPGPDGPRQRVTDIARHSADDESDDDGHPAPWHTELVAGDLVQVVAHGPAGQALEVALLDPRGEPVQLVKTPGGRCQLGTRVPCSGHYRVRVRNLARPLRPVPFLMTVERQVPRRHRHLLWPLSGRRRGGLGERLQHWIDRLVDALGGPFGPPPPEPAAA